MKSKFAFPLIPVAQLPDWFAEQGLLATDGNKLSWQTVYRWIQDGLFPVIELPRKHAHVDDLQAFLKQRRAPVKPAGRGRKKKPRGRTSPQATETLKRYGVI